MSEVCSGCIENNGCPVQDQHLVNECPCISCLIKVMCKTACRDWDIMHDICIKHFKEKKKERV